jgi:IS5 family transposase
MYLDFSRESSLKVVREYRAKYEAIDGILGANPEIVRLAHRDLGKHLSESKGGREATYTSEQILRAVIVMFIEDDSYREVVIRIEESGFLRRFVALGVKPMMDFTFLSKAFGCLAPETWEAINRSLRGYAVKQEKITGEKLRVDTTAVETNIHYPTDASLLWDSYRTLVRLLRRIRDAYPWICAKNRFHDQKVKRRYLFITRKAKSTSKRTRRKVKTAYRELIEAVRRVLAISEESVKILGSVDPFWREELHHFQPLVEWVIDQAERRVFHGEMLPANEKLYSIFEEHTELLKRGKARKPVEFGHMVLLGQTAERFISQYRVMPERIEDKDLLRDAVDTHKRHFDEAPQVLAADKGFYESMKELQKLEKEIETVSICKKGRRTEAEKEREVAEEFKAGQRFRAGIEGSISVLKRVFKLGRCLFKGYRNFASSIGCAVFCHNLVALTRL